MGAEPALACQRRAARVQLPGWERQAPCSLWLPMSSSAQPAISSSSAFGERPLRRQPRELQTAGGNADPFNTLAEMEVLYANGDGGLRSLRVQAEPGEYRWIVDTDVPRFDADGKFIDY